MKTLMLLRHAKSSWAEPDKEDFDRPLNDRGIKDAPIMGKLISGLETVPQKIFSSAALRAKMTAQAVSAELSLDIPVEWVDDFYHFDAFGMMEYLKGIPDQFESVLLIGHNPTFEELTSLLISKGSTALHFPTAALAVLSSEIGNWKDAGKEMFALELLAIPRALKSFSKGKNSE